MHHDPHEAGQRLKDFRKEEALEEYLARLNRYLLPFDGDKDLCGPVYPVIYVVGLPRSGTTLLSQLISRYLPFGYINNIIARLWLNPVVGIRLSQAILGSEARERIVFESTHGVTADPWGPHEFGYFWRHWLRLDDAPTHKLSPEHLENVDRTGLRNMLRAMIGAFAAPLVFKNIICGLQAEFLSQLYPSTLFVLIERDPKAVAASLLRSREARYGDPAIWWSLKPSTYHEISRIQPTAAQIDRQIADSARDFALELAKPGVRFIRFSYENLCSDPVKCLNMIAGEVTALGHPVSLLGRPPALKRSH
jgi:hypothetical protein